MDVCVYCATCDYFLLIELQRGHGNPGDHVCITCNKKMKVDVVHDNG